MKYIKYNPIFVPEEFKRVIEYNNKIFAYDDMYGYKIKKDSLYHKETEIYLKEHPFDESCDYEDYIEKSQRKLSIFI